VAIRNWLPWRSEVVHGGEQGELPAWQKGGFGLVEQVEAVGLEAVVDQGEEGLAAGLLVERLADVGVDD
jgi:hypothetical protein